MLRALYDSIKSFSPKEFSILVFPSFIKETPTNFDNLEKKSTSLIYYFPVYLISSDLVSDEISQISDFIGIKEFWTKDGVECSLPYKAFTNICEDVKEMDLNFTYVNLIFIPHLISDKINDLYTLFSVVMDCAFECPFHYLDNYLVNGVLPHPDYFPTNYNKKNKLNFYLHNLQRNELIQHFVEFLTLRESFSANQLLNFLIDKKNTNKECYSFIRKKLKACFDFNIKKVSKKVHVKPDHDHINEHSNVFQNDELFQGSKSPIIESSPDLEHERAETLVDEIELKKYSTSESDIETEIPEQPIFANIEFHHFLDWTILNLCLDNYRSKTELHENDIKKRNNVIETIKKCLGKDYQVDIFGGFAYGVSAVDGDIDINITTNTDTFDRELEIEELYKIKNKLSRDFKRLIVIKARVPILHRISGPFTFDISLNHSSSIIKTKLIKCYFDLMPNLACAFHILKEWGKKCGFIDSKHYQLSSHSISLMLVGMCMKYNFVPNLQDSASLRNIDKKFIITELYKETNSNFSFINGSFYDNISMVGKEISVAKILLLFISFYGFYFDSNNFIVAISKGGILPNDLPKNIRTPLIVIDPVDEGFRNTSAALSYKSLLRMRRLFRATYFSLIGCKDFSNPWFSHKDSKVLQEMVKFEPRRRIYLDQPAYSYQSSYQEFIDDNEENTRKRKRKKL